MRAKLGAPKAIAATAHKLARIVYGLLTTRESYDGPGSPRPNTTTGIALNRG
jgi:transposase